VQKISFKRLEEILETINPRVVNEIDITLSSSCSSDMPFWATVKTGYRVYEIMLGDCDDRYWENSIVCFFNIIRNSGLKYRCNEYKQQTCSCEKIWKV